MSNFNSIIKPIGSKPSRKIRKKKILIATSCSLLAIAIFVPSIVVPISFHLNKKPSISREKLNITSIDTINIESKIQKTFNTYDVEEQKLIYKFFKGQHSSGKIFDLLKGVFTFNVDDTPITDGIESIFVSIYEGEWPSNGNPIPKITVDYNLNSKYDISQIDPKLLKQEFKNLGLIGLKKISLQKQNISNLENIIKSLIGSDPNSQHTNYKSLAGLKDNGPIFEGVKKYLSFINSSNNEIINDAITSIEVNISSSWPSANNPIPKITIKANLNSSKYFLGSEFIKDLTFDVSNLGNVNYISLNLQKQNISNLENLIKSLIGSDPSSQHTNYKSLAGLKDNGPIFEGVKKYLRFINSSNNEIINDAITSIEVNISPSWPSPNNPIPKITIKTNLNSSKYFLGSEFIKDLTFDVSNLGNSITFNTDVFVEVKNEWFIFIENEIKRLIGAGDALSQKNNYNFISSEWRQIWSIVERFLEIKDENNNLIKNAFESVNIIISKSIVNIPNFGDKIPSVEIEAILKPNYLLKNSSDKNKLKFTVNNLGNFARTLINRNSNNSKNWYDIIKQQIYEYSKKYNGNVYYGYNNLPNFISLNNWGMHPQLNTYMENLFWGILNWNTFTLNDGIELIGTVVVKNVEIIKSTDWPPFNINDPKLPKTKIKINLNYNYTFGNDINSFEFWITSEYIF